MEGGWGLPPDFSIWNGAKLPQLWKSNTRKKRCTNSGDLENRNKKKQGFLGVYFLRSKGEYDRQSHEQSRGQNVDGQKKEGWMGIT